MVSRRRLLAAAALLAACGATAMAHADEPLVVQVRYRVSEQDTERVERTVTSRLERPLHGMPRVVAMNSVTSHGSVAIEIGFDGGATGDDVDAVARRLDEIALPPEVVVLSRSVRLGPRMRDPGQPPSQPR